MIPSKRILNSRKRQRSTRKPSKRTRKQRGGQAMTTSLGDLTTTSLGDTTTLGDPATTTTDTTVRALLESALTKAISMPPTDLNTAATMAENQYINATPEQQTRIREINEIIEPFIQVASWKVINPIVFNNLVDPTVDTTSINTLLSLFQNALADTVKMTPEDIVNTHNIVKAQYSNTTPTQGSQLRDISDRVIPFIVMMKIELIKSIILEVPITPAQTT